MRKRKLYAEYKAQIITDYRNGKSVLEITEDYGISKNYIYEFLKDAGIRISEARNERNTQIIKAFQRGKSIIEIVNFFGICETRVRQILKAAGANAEAGRRRSMKEVSIEYPETREIVGGEVHPRGTGARLAAAVKVLRSLQWSAGGIGQAACPVCHKLLERGHTSYCELAALLGGEG